MMSNPKGDIAGVSWQYILNISPKKKFTGELSRFPQWGFQNLEGKNPHQQTPPKKYQNTFICKMQYWYHASGAGDAKAALLCKSGTFTSQFGLMWIRFPKNLHRGWEQMTGENECLLHSEIWEDSCLNSRTAGKRTIAHCYLHPISKTIWHRWRWAKAQ